MIEAKHISVVMPVYNGEKYIKKSIESILNQTYSNLEFIIVNDFSNDSTLEIILKFIKKDHRIKLINNEKRYHLWLIMSIFAYVLYIKPPTVC